MYRAQLQAHPPSKTELQGKSNRISTPSLADGDKSEIKNKV